jgi:hypothetical protein
MSTVDSRPGPITSVLNWLRKGYPNGVPTKDYFPLLALLRRRLTDDELDQIVDDLTVSGHLPADRAVIRTTIEKVVQQDPTDEDLALVAARLAAAGWPLAGELERPEGSKVVDEQKANGHPDSPLVRPAFLRAILGWLREGYPNGVPTTDYIPLLALLRRRLSDEETAWVAGEIVASGHAPVGAADIGVLITKVTNEMPSDDDINRVRAQLEAAGYPVVPPSEGV